VNTNTGLCQQTVVNIVTTLWLASSGKVEGEARGFCEDIPTLTPPPTLQNLGYINMHKIKAMVLHLQEDSEHFLSQFFCLPLFFTIKQLETSVANPVTPRKEPSQLFSQPPLTTHLTS
jgi:hypothetical protein